jgi:hypothetical protein
MRLLADSGGTGTDWALINKGETTFFKGVGLHPDTIVRTTRLPDDLIKCGKEIEDIRFYGTGCANTQKAALVKAFLASYFTKAEIYVHSDLMALAHPVLQKEKGLVGILGTGSSMCFYDGNSIHFEVNSPGKGIDPGSGTVIGEKFWRDYLNGSLSEHVNGLIQKRIKVSDDHYNLAELNEIVFSNLHDDVIRKLVETSFEEFFSFYKPLWGKYKQPLVLGGTIAALGSALLTDVAVRNNLVVKDYVRYPIERLVSYYS